MIVEPCACGGLIAAPSREESAPAVSKHNRTRRHRSWRMKGGFTEHNPAHDLFLTALEISQELFPGETFPPLAYPQRSILLRRSGG